MTSLTQVVPSLFIAIACFYRNKFSSSQPLSLSLSLSPSLSLSLSHPHPHHILPPSTIPHRDQGTMDHHCDKNRAAPLLPTPHNGETFEVKAELMEHSHVSLAHSTSSITVPILSRSPSFKFPSSPSCLHNIGLFDEASSLHSPGSFDGASSQPCNSPLRRQNSFGCTTSSPLANVVDSDDIPERKKESPTRRRRCANMSDRGPCENVHKSWMDYNEYGELVDVETLLNPPTVKDLSTTQILRLIKKAYHHDVRVVRTYDWDRNINVPNTPNLIILVRH